MPNKQPEMLEALKQELHFLENGGYEPSLRREPRGEVNIFLDSPLCLNVLPVNGAYPAECRLFPCSKCWLIGFVPLGQRFAAVPCHNIPLNASGDTIASMGKSHDNIAMQDAVRGWLWAKRQEIEAKPAHPQPPSPPKVAGVMARSQLA